MPEDVFWHRMSPARLHALYNAHFGKQAKEPEAPKSLSEYLRGG